ncbi:hypothetical protein T08_15325 [Trichinella sp. T8]|nr:hypothetical protein T08_15325 [Trichinella sp. T8]
MSKALKKLTPSLDVLSKFSVYGARFVRGKLQKQLKFSGLNSTGNQSDKGLIYCTEIVGDKVTGEARVASIAGLRHRFNSAVALLQMPTATQVASILIHLVWNCTAAILSSLCIFPNGVQYQPAPNGGLSPRSPV